MKLRSRRVNSISQLKFLSWLLGYQLQVRRCLECGQPLPDTYQRPADEDWTTGIFGCAEDPESCWKGLFCPCILFGQNVETMRDDTPWTGPCVCHVLCIEGSMVAAAATGMFHGVDPKKCCLILEGLIFTWWLCGIYKVTQASFVNRCKRNIISRIHLAIHAWYIAAYIHVLFAKNTGK